jgi:hypothetical protein
MTREGDPAVKGPAVDKGGLSDDRKDVAIDI